MICTTLGFLQKDYILSWLLPPDWDQQTFLWVRLDARMSQPGHLRNHLMLVPAFSYLLFSQAKNFKVCQSQSTFTKIKRELVQYGLLDPLDGGGLNAPAIFKVSNRWNRYGDEDFKELKYKSGFSSKFFKGCSGLFQSYNLDLFP